MSEKTPADAPAPAEATPDGGTASEAATPERDGGTPKTTPGGDGGTVAEATPGGDGENSDEATSGRDAKTPREGAATEAATPEREDELESFEVADGGAGDLDAPGRFAGPTRAETIATIQADAVWQPRANSPEELGALVERLPDLSGVYIMRDRKGEVVYVGKARRLRARVRQYFNGTDPRLFVPFLAQMLGDIETVVTSNDKEALLLENNLIKKYKPRFNVKLRDDKQFLVLRIDPKANWPRLELVRRMRQDGARYFGPYHSAQSARHTLRVVNRYFKLRTCSDYTLAHRKRPCLQYQIGRCPAPCVYPVDPAAYGAQVRGVGMFLEGRHKELVADLTTQMEDAAGALEFETAARLRDQLQAVTTSLERQQVVGSATLDQDVVGMYREGGQVEFVLMHVRQGKLLGTHTFSARGMELPDPDVLGSFLIAYYDDAPTIPDEVLLPAPLADDDAGPLRAWLREHSGRKVTLLVPERGDRKKLLALAQRNAMSNFASRRNRAEDSEQALRCLQQRLGLSRLPRVIECYDISHIQGQDTVASMVVFVDGAADKRRYRSFKIRGLGDAGLAQGDRQNDDFASMREVLSRRLKRALVREDMSEEAGDAAAEAGEWALPDLLVIDGGKGQLGRVIAALRDLGVAVGEGGVDVVSLAKERRMALGRGRAALQKLRSYRSDADAAAALEEATSSRAEDAPVLDEPDPEARPGQSYQDFVVRDMSEGPETWEVKPERVFVPGAKDPIRLRPGSSELYLMTQIRDEAHRFAITHHRKRRGKRALHSALDDIPGVGPALKKALIQHFGTVAEIRAAEPGKLTEVKGVGTALAQRIHEALREA